MTQEIFRTIDPVVPPLLQNVVTFNKSEYIYCVVLLNGEGPFLNLTTDNIVGLNITDNLTKFTHSGELILNNNNDILERAYTTPGESYNVRQIETNQQNLEFFFRGDGRDLVLILITPRSSDVLNEQDIPTFKNPFTLKFLFSVTNVRDDIAPDGTKLKILTLEDLDNRFLQEKNLGFSTSNFLNVGNVVNLDNNDRGIPTGNIIRQILIQTLTDGLAKDSNTQISFADNDAWDTGASDFFYSSPCGSNAYQDLQYILKRHVSRETYDPCVLRKERNNVWSLMSLANYFKNGYIRDIDSAGPLHIEKFLIQSVGATVNVVLKKERTPSNIINNTGFYNSSYITNYKLHYSEAKDLQDNVLTYAVHSYQLNDKQFNIDMSRNNIETTKKVFTNLYVDPMKGDDDRPIANFYINALRKTNKNLKNVFVPVDYSEDQRLNWGRNLVMLNALYKNMTIEFEVDGISHRQAGRFISIDREDALPSSKYDDRLLGIWLIVNVEHVFTSTTYVNRIIAVKTYSYSMVGGNSDIE